MHTGLGIAEQTQVKVSKQEIFPLISTRWTVPKRPSETELAILKKRGGFTVNQVAKQLKRDVSTVRAIMYRMQQEGKLGSEKRARATDAGGFYENTYWVIR